MVKPLGIAFGVLVVLFAWFFAVCAAVFYGYNWIAEAYGWPMIQSFWHVVVGVLVLRLILGARRFK